MDDGQYLEQLIKKLKWRENFCHEAFLEAKSREDNSAASWAQESIILNEIIGNLENRTIIFDWDWDHSGL